MEVLSICVKVMANVFFDIVDGKTQFEAVDSVL